MKTVVSIIGLGVLCRAYILNAIFPVTIFKQEHLLFFDLISYHFLIPFWTILLFGLINTFLIFLIGDKLFHYKIAILSALFYTISPWTIYLEVAGSVYIVFLTILLLTILGIVKMKQEESSKIGMTIFLIGTNLLLLSSVVFWFIVPIITAGIIVWLPLKINPIKTTTSVLVIMFVFLLLLVIKNVQGFSNILSNEIAIFSEVGLLNGVNQFQGDLAREGAYSFGRIIENRYTYFAQYLFFIFLRHFALVTYFTSEYKLLNFSFSPPILSGLIIPFIFGLKGWISIFKRIKYLAFFPLLLITPSVLSYKSPDFAKLIIVSPVIFYTIGFGLVNYLLLTKSKTAGFLKIICLLLIVIQGLVIISDIKYREPARIDPLRFPNIYQYK